MDSRFEFTFSYWLFAWFVCYYLGIINYNPKIWLLMATVYNMWLLMCMFYYKYTGKYIVLYIVLLVILKLIPLWLLRMDSYKWRDFIAGVGLFVVYVLWVYCRLGSVSNMLHYYNGISQNMREGKPFSPWITLLYR